MTDPVPSALPDSGASVQCTDELLTGESALPTSTKVRKQSAGPAATVRHGSASVPIYRIISGTRTRFAISWYRDGKRMRQVFRTIEAAKKEALVVARQIQAGMQHLTDPRACRKTRTGSAASHFFSGLGATKEKVGTFDRGATKPCGNRAAARRGTRDNSQPIHTLPHDQTHIRSRSRLLHQAPEPAIPPPSFSATTGSCPRRRRRGSGLGLDWTEASGDNGNALTGWDGPGNLVRSISWNGCC